MARLELRDIPELPHYISVAQAAAVFGISKTSVYYMIYDQGLFEVVYRIGGDPEDPSGLNERPFLLLLKAEVSRVKKAKDAAAQAGPPLLVRVKEWNRRVKEWGKENGFGPSSPAGRPNRLLVAAYNENHPDDPRPA